MHFSNGNGQSYRPSNASTTSNDPLTTGEGQYKCAASNDLEQKLSTTYGGVDAGQPSKVWEYNEILDLLGFGKVQWLLIFISGLLTMTSMSAQLAMGIISIATQCEFNMTQSDKGIMMAACVTGIVISTYICGYICDTLGRRTVLMWSMFITNLLQFTTIFVSNIWVFNSFNFLTGISLGGILAAIYPYLGEFNSNKYRAVALNISVMFVSVTFIYVPAISWLILSYDWSWYISDSLTLKPWRLIILFSILPGLVGALLLLTFPESPIFLLAHGRHNEALEALNWMSKLNKGANLENTLETTNISLKPEAISEVPTGRGCGFITNIWKATVPMFHKPHGRNIVLAVVVMFGMLFVSNGMQIWYPEIVNRSADSSALGESGTICSLLDDSYARDRVTNMNVTATKTVICDNSINTKTYVDNIIVGLAFFIGFAIQGALLNTLGRKNVVLASLALAGLCGLLLHIITNTTGILILFSCYILLPGLAMSIMIGALVDLAPTHLKGKAVSMGMTMSRLGVIVASHLVAALLEPYCNLTFAIVTMVVIVCAALVHFLPM